MDVISLLHSLQADLWMARSSGSLQEKTHLFTLAHMRLSWSCAGGCEVQGGCGCTWPEMGEVAKIKEDVEVHGLNLVVFGEWYNLENIQKMRFFDDNTRSWWTPVTGVQSLCAPSI
eukprot:1039426-Pelagomonas_calceolata.AAC.2